MKTSELSVIQANPMEDSGVEVIDCMRINHGLLTEIIGGSDDLASFHTASSHRTIQSLARIRFRWTEPKLARPSTLFSVRIFRTRGSTHGADLRHQFVQQLSLSTLLTGRRIPCCFEKDTQIIMGQRTT